MQEFASSSTLFGGNAPFIEEQYERYLANPADGRAASGGRYFDSLRGGAADVAHAPVIESFIELAKQPQGRRRDGRRVDDAQAGARAAAHQQVPHARHVPRRPRSAEAAGKAATSPISTSRPTASRRPTSTPSSTSARSRPAPTGCGCRPHRGAAGHVLPHARRRVHVHLGHADQALRPAAAGADPRAADVFARASSGTSSSG